MNLTWWYESNRSRKLEKLFKDHDLKMATITNAKVINFLDMTLDLNTSKYKTYIKELSRLRHVNNKSNDSPDYI